MSIDANGERKEDILRYLKKIVEDIEATDEKVTWEVNIEQPSREIEPANGYRQYEPTRELRWRVEVAYLRPKPGTIGDAGVAEAQALMGNM